MATEVKPSSDTRPRIEVYHPDGGGPRVILEAEWPMYETQGFLKAPKARTREESLAAKAKTLAEGKKGKKKAEPLGDPEE